MVDSVIAAYYLLVLVIFGTLFNVFTLIVFCRSTFRSTQARPTIHYLRTIAIFDILILYGWNLDHYLTAVYGFTKINIYFMSVLIVFQLFYRPIIGLVTCVCLS